MPIKCYGLFWLADEVTWNLGGATEESSTCWVEGERIDQPCESLTFASRAVSTSSTETMVLTTSA